MFKNREEAGCLLLPKLEKVAKGKDFLAVGITRGGVVLGRVIADHFKMPLAALVIKKIGSPYNNELAIGAVGGKKIAYWDEDLIKRLKVSKSYRSSALKEKGQEVKNLEKMFFSSKNVLGFKDKRVILVDDGVATGTTVLCSQKILKKQNPKQLILATPVISKDSYYNIRKYFDNIIALEKPLRFLAVGQFYKDFPQVEDEEVVRLLASSN